MLPFSSFLEGEVVFWKPCKFFAGNVLCDFNGVSLWEIWEVEGNGSGFQFSVFSFPSEGEQSGRWRAGWAPSCPLKNEGETGR